MCGISGYIGKNCNNGVIQKMNNAMSLRGPDDRGFWLNNNKTICLGQTRLSIIDLSNQAHQPMQSQNSRFTLVFNGEIYNFREIKQELVSTYNAHFNSNSDTEVILVAWEKWGKSCINKLRGMFAFAMWDELENELFLVRDRLGIKPLHYTLVNNQFIFASSLSAVLATDLVDKKIKIEGLIEYISYGSVFQPKTMIEDVFTLMPASILSFKNNKITIEKYWELSKNKKIAKDLANYDYNELVKLTKNKLEETCKYHLVADVQVGSFMSGGVDSTSITAILAKQSNYQIKTFSIGFENDKYYTNELAEAKKAADFIGTEHYEQVITSNFLKNVFENFIDGIDQPSADGLNTFLVSKLAHPHVKVVLSGLGADELFAGYTHFEWLNTLNIGRNKLKDQVLSKFFDFFPWLGIVNQAHFETLNLNEKFIELRRKLYGFDFYKVFSKSILNNRILPIPNSYQQADLNFKSIHDISVFECNNYLLNTLLRDSDALSMANSLELRPIFLDHELVQFALSLPDNVKIKNGVLKSVLRDATKDFRPKDFSIKIKKGFELPINRWLGEDMKDYVISILNDEYTYVFFNRKYIANLILNIKNPRKNNMLLQIITFMSWAKKNKVTI